MCCFVTGPNTFDSPSAVAAAMTGSLAGLMDVMSPDDKKKGGYHEMLSTFDIIGIHIISNKKPKKKRKNPLCVFKRKAFPLAEPSAWLKSAVCTSTSYWTHQEASKGRSLRNPGMPPLLWSERSALKQLSVTTWDLTVKSLMHLWS